MLSQPSIPQPGFVRQTLFQRSESVKQYIALTCSMAERIADAGAGLRTMSPQRAPPTLPGITPARNPQHRPQAAADTRARRARGEVRRRQIVEAAVELFASSGYRGTGLAALADRVGMTVPGLMYYFGTKERLLLDVVAERDRADGLSPEPISSFSALRELGRHNVETAVLTRLYVVLGAESLDRDDPLHDFFVRRYETARSLVRELVVAGVEGGSIRPDVDVAQIALEVVGMLMGLEIQWLTDPVSVDLARAVEAYVDRLARELGP